ncbi:transmembrane and coiled-coil domains protein 3-like [Scleropages formosus]|uniref:Transmembrane and coiled-coil domains protein 3-like n=1 Tax=Scleropages formosus TaxID=113540 RepID=A0A0N8JWW1_SCLFO|nr:transmembrane and coiled-coil domains protein 3-like [Scleropages formosus]
MFCSCQADRSIDGNVLSIPVPMRRGGSETNLDLDSTDGPGFGLDFHKGRLGIDSLQQKILKVTEQIKIEQTARDENVAEYLKLVNNADKQQVSRIKQVFEKKNQKSAQNIAQLQKKLEQYHKRMKDSEANGASKHTGPKEVKESSKDNLKESLKDSLKDVSGSGRHPSLDKVKTIGPGVSLSPPFFFNKPREFANLIRNKFGSADNIAQIKSSMETSSAFHPEGGGRALSGSATIVTKPKYPSDDECSSGSSASADSNGNPAPGPVVTGSPEAQGRSTQILEELREIRESQNQLAEDIESIKSQFKREFGVITQVLQEEKYRFERLEDQLNDLTELHQHETTNLKQELASMEEKVAYQAYERARDIQVRYMEPSNLELQQQQQQTVQLENTDAKVLLGKCINIMLALVTVILVCVSTVAKFTAPLTRSRLHVFGTFVAVSLLALFWKNWEHLQCALERLLVPS